MTILTLTTARFLCPFWILWSMLIHCPVLSYVYPEDIPGSHCSPDDGPWHCLYKIHQEDNLWHEFVACPSLSLLHLTPGRLTWSTFSPCIWSNSLYTETALTQLFPDPSLAHLLVVLVGY